MSAELRSFYFIFALISGHFALIFYRKIGNVSNKNPFEKKSIFFPFNHEYVYFAKILNLNINYNSNHAVQFQDKRS